MSEIQEGSQDEERRRSDSDVVMLRDATRRILEQLSKNARLFDSVLCTDLRKALTELERSDDSTSDDAKVRARRCLHLVHVRCKQSGLH